MLENLTEDIFPKACPPSLTLTPTLTVPERDLEYWNGCESQPPRRNMSQMSKWDGAKME